MLQDGELHLSCQNYTIQREDALPVKEGDYLKISIADTGVGIPAEIFDKIFDPYFSTKPKGAQKGMGLGLTIAYSIIHKHDGHITVESKVGKGTTVQIYLPADVS